MRGLALGLVVAMLGGCGPPEVQYRGGEGTRPGAAIVIRNAMGELGGIEAEHAWIRKNRPGAHITGQGVMRHGGRVYDVVAISRRGRPEQLYFDITRAVAS